MTDRFAAVDAWVLVGPEDHVFVGTLHRDRDRVCLDAAAVCVLNRLTADQVRIASARIVVDLETAVVFAEDPAHASAREASEMAKRTLT